MIEEVDLNSIFSKNYKVFFYFGFWKPDYNYRYKLIYNLYTFSCFSVLILFLLPQVVYMIINRTDIYEVTGTMYVFCTFFINLIKIIGIYVNINLIKRVLSNLKNNPLLQAKFSKHKELAEKTKHLGDYLFYYGSFLGFGTQLFWTLTPMLQEKRTLPINGWYPYDPMVTPHFQLTSLFQNFASAFNILHTMNTDSFTINLMMQVGLQCDFLRETLENLTSFQTDRDFNLDYKSTLLDPKKANFEEEMTKNLIRCIRHYIEIKKLSNCLEAIYRVSMAVVFLGGAFIFCTILYQLLQLKGGSTQFFYLMFFLFSMLTEQFIFCWFGNEITSKSGKLYCATYNIPLWTDCNVKFRKMLILFMISLKKPMAIYAVGIIPLSLRVFMHVLRTSYSYLTLLNSL